jgi:hypothetical protein
VSQSFGGPGELLKIGSDKRKKEKCNFLKRIIIDLNYK